MIVPRGHCSLLSVTSDHVVKSEPEVKFFHQLCGKAKFSRLLMLMIQVYREKQEGAEIFKTKQYHVSTP